VVFGVSTAEDIKMRVQFLVTQILGPRDWERFGEVFAEGFIDHDPDEGQPAGPEGITWFWENFSGAFPDFVLAPNLISADDEYVTLVSEISGTHTGEYFGHAPTGRKFQIRSLQTFKFANGRVVERWGSSDTLRLEQELELL
jgi:predicted ester cyclase